MKRLSFVLTLVLQCCAAFAHEIIVHRAITAHAADSALSYSDAFPEFLNAISADCSYETAGAAMVNGSEYEDYVFKDEGGARSVNHFYDPLTAAG